VKKIFIGLDAGNVNLNLDDAGIDAIHRCAQGFIEHEVVRSQPDPSIECISTSQFDQSFRSIVLTNRRDQSSRPMKIGPLTATLLKLTILGG
jgi:hypothetical protein